MHGWKRLTSTGLGLVAALAAAIAPVSASAPTRRWVDDDGHAGPGGCSSPGHAFQHIQSAVDASGADDTVIVCPGTYVEQVHIDGHRDGLTLRSSRPFGATIKAPASLARPAGFSYLVFIDQVNRVTLAGFKTVTRTQGSCETVDAAIVAVGSLQASIRGNRTLAPGAGPDAACYQGYGILLVDALHSGSSTAAASGTILYNEIRDTYFTGIGAFSRSAGTNANIIHNSVRAYFGHPAVGGSPMGGVSYSGEYGIGLLGRSRGTIRDNVIQGAGAAPAGGATFFVGIVVSGSFLTSTGAYSNGPVDVRDNTVRRVVYGLQIAGSDQASVRRNHFTNTYAAVVLQQARGVSVQSNHLGAKAIGIYVDAVSHNNLFRHNRVTGNGGTCQDASSGAGTAGTANRWTSNTATQASNPNGICVVAP